MKKYKLTEAEMRQIALKEALTRWRTVGVVTAEGIDYTEVINDVMLRYNSVMRGLKAYNRSVDEAF